jgi:hypothetical protein
MGMKQNNRKRKAREARLSVMDSSSVYSVWEQRLMNESKAAAKKEIMTKRSSGSKKTKAASPQEKKPEAKAE